MCVCACVCLCSLCYSSNPNSEEAVSSMEIDSSANDGGQHKTLITSPDSYVSTTNITANEPTEPASHAQVLEELRARIRELEGSPLKMRSNHDEEHYKCYICKVGRLTLSVLPQFSHIFFIKSNLCSFHSSNFVLLVIIINFVFSLCFVCYLLEFIGF